MKKTSAKKVPAKRGRQRKQDSVLLERADKVVLRDKDSVLKIFGPSYKVSLILNEAMNEARAAETGLPVAKVLEVMKLRDHWCIRREWVEGETLADVMDKDKKNLQKYLRQFVAIQCEIFGKTSDRMGNLADKLDKQISASPLPRETRYDLHMKLQSFPRGKALCHGDFNPTNVIITPHHHPQRRVASHRLVARAPRRPSRGRRPHVPALLAERPCRRGREVHGARVRVAQGEGLRRPEVAADRRRRRKREGAEREEPRTPAALGERR